MIDKRTNHASLELFLEVHDIMRKIQVLRHGLGVVDIVERAATVLRGAIALELREAALIPQLHGEADDGAALLLQEGGNGGRVDASRHSDGDESALRFGALGESIELGGCVHVNYILADVPHREAR